MDVASAYLHTPLDPKEKLYLRPPKGFEIVARSMGLEYEEGDLMLHLWTQTGGKRVVFEMDR